MRALFSCMAWRPITSPLSKLKRRLDSLKAAQGAPRDPRRDSRGERSPWLPLVKNLPSNAGDIRDMGLIPGWEDLLEESTLHGNPLQYSCLENALHPSHLLPQPILLVIPVHQP